MFEDFICGLLPALPFCFFCSFLFFVLELLVLVVDYTRLLIRLVELSVGGGAHLLLSPSQGVENRLFLANELRIATNIFVDTAGNNQGY